MEKIVIAILLLLPAHAWAQNFYVYGAIGLQSRFHIDRDQRDNVSAGIFGQHPNESLATENDGNPWKLQFGYQITKQIAVEAGWTDFGGATYFSRFNFPDPLNPRNGFRTEEWSARGYNFAAVGTTPIAGGFSLLGKVGAIRATVDYRAYTNVIPGIPSSMSASDTRWTGIYGAGIMYELPHTPFAFRLEYDRVHNVGNDATAGRRSIDLVSFGVGVKF